MKFQRRIMRFVLTGFKLFEIYRPSYKFTDTSRLLPCASVLPYHIAPCNEKPAPLSAATREPNPPKFFMPSAPNPGSSLSARNLNR
jgi:hypothetical protein